MLSHREIGRLVAAIVRRTDPEEVIVFGSYAKGTATDRSDLDLLVVRETMLPLARRTEDVLPLLQSRLIPVDVHVYTPEEVREFGREEYSFLNTVLRTGRTVYRRSSEVSGPGHRDFRPTPRPRPGL